MKNHSIKHRILFLAMFPAFAIAALLTALFMIGGLSEIDDAMKARGGVIARQLAPASEYGAFSGNREILQALAQSVMAEKDIKAVVITDARNNILAASGHPSRLKDDSANGAGKESSLIFVAPIYQNGIEIDDFGHFDRRMHVESDKKKILGQVHVELTTASTQQRKNTFIAASVLIASLVLLGAFLLALRMSRDVTAPLSNLLDAVTRMTDGRLDTRVTTASGGELAALENGFNHMAEKLQAAHIDMQARILEATAMLAKKEKAEQASSAKTRFLAAASHDLRQPVQAMNWFVGALQQRITDEQSLHVCRMMQESVKSLNELLETLLDISKLDAGIVTPAKEPIPVNSLLMRLKNEFSTLISSQEIVFRVHFTDAWVETDPNMLMMALRNLLSNAVKYTGRGKILLGCRRRGNGLAIQVWDSGIGIPSSELTNIFQEFYQIGNREQERRQGLGLGLAIVDRVIKLLGHTLNVRSTVGKGSVFEVILPLSPRAEISPPDAEDPASISKNVLVAVVDDEPEILEGIIYLLEGFGYQAIGAGSAAELLDSLAKCTLPPDIILADYRLRNNMTGIDAIQSLRERSGCAVPAIIITGDTGAERLREVAGQNIALLHKPIDSDKLVFAIEKSLARKKQP